MAVVQEQRIGHTTIRIHDDYCRDRTPEETQAVLNRIAAYVQAELSTAAEEREREEGAV